MAVNLPLQHVLRNPQKNSESFGRIINKASLERLVSYLEEDHGGRVLCGGRHTVADSYIEPTIIVDPRNESAIMNEEIFGPILVVKSVKSMQEALDLIASKPHPLAAYCFTRSLKIEREFSANVKSGALGVNDCLWHW